MLILCLLVLLMLLPRPAHAYIDPGSGSLLLQWLIALLVGGWLTVKLFAGKLWRKLRRGRDADEASDDETPGDGSS